MAVLIVWKWFMCLSACVEHFNKKLKEYLVSDIKGENSHGFDNISNDKIPSLLFLSHPVHTFTVAFPTLCSNYVM